MLKYIHYFALLLFFSTTPLIATNLIYTETMNNETYDSNWQLYPSGNLDIISGNTMLAHVYIEQKNNKTYRWINKHKHDNLSFTATRITTNLYIELEENDTVVTQKIHLGPYNWFQTPGFLLKPFILSQEESIQFVIIRIPALSPILMEVKKVTEEPLTLNGITYNAIKTELYPASFLKYFWKAPMWFDKATGNVLKYDGFIGGPGSKPFQIIFSSSTKN